MHGLSVPIGKLGYHLPRTLSSAIGSNSASMDPEEPEEPFRLHDRSQPGATLRPDRDRRVRDEPPRPVFRIGGSIIQSTEPDAVNLGTNIPAQKATTAPEDDIEAENRSVRSSEKAEVKS